jgi:hypothetical protein
MENAHTAFPSKIISAKWRPLTNYVKTGKAVKTQRLNDDLVSSK